MGCLSLERKLYNLLLSKPSASWHGRLVRRCPRHAQCSGASQDEAYELGQQWAKLYEADSPSRRLIRDLMDDFLLVNVVHNDYKDAGAIFEPFSGRSRICRQDHDRAANTNGTRELKR